jgi:hypothetical protein
MESADSKADSTDRLSCRCKIKRRINNEVFLSNAMIIFCVDIGFLLGIRIFVLVLKERKCI